MLRNEHCQCHLTSFYCCTHSSSMNSSAFQQWGIRPCKITLPNISHLWHACFLVLLYITCHWQNTTNYAFAMTLLSLKHVHLQFSLLQHCFLLLWLCYNFGKILFSMDTDREMELEIKYKKWKKKPAWKTILSCPSSLPLYLEHMPLQCYWKLQP